MISWSVVNSSTAPLVIEILQRYAWRYDYYNSPLCTSASIPLGLPIIGNNSYRVLCAQTCPTNLTVLGPVPVPCTGFNIGEDYAMGEGRFTFQARANTSFVATFSGSGWFSLVTGNNLAWSVAVEIQTYRRSDTGKYNNAPIITMLPIYRLRNLISYSIKINVADNDYDPYICLWSNGSIQTGGLNNSVPGGIIDNYGCFLNFTPNIVGFYAVAITVKDFLILPTNISASNYLSQVPIQFIFHVYTGTGPCSTGPLYLGDLPADSCIYMDVGSTQTVRVRIQVKCPNATLNSTINVNPTGLLTTPPQQDPSDSTMYAFIVNFTASAQQVGQNLFCFAGVDSLGNQGDSACLRFAVATETSSLQPLYTSNATRYPMGTVSKNTSTWTILTGSLVYSRPDIEAYVRFKRTADNSDFYVLNVMTAIDQVLYLTDRIIIITNVIWTSNDYYYIYMDAGVFAAPTTCSRNSMPISDPQFWPFNIPYESTVTSTTSTSTTSISSTTTLRTIPTRQTLATTVTTVSTTITTVTTVTTRTVSFQSSTIYTSTPISVISIVGITLGSIFGAALLVFVSLFLLRIFLIRYFLLEAGLRHQLLSNRAPSTFDAFEELRTMDSQGMQPQYKLATHNREQDTIHTYLIESR